MTGLWDLEAKIADAIAAVDAAGGTYKDQAKAALRVARAALVPALPSITLPNESSISPSEAAAEAEARVEQLPAEPDTELTEDHCGAIEGVTGIRCMAYPGHQDWHSGKHTPHTDGHEIVGYPMRLQWPRTEWDTCAPTSNVFRQGDREPSREVRVVRGGRSGWLYTRRSENYGGPWDYMTTGGSEWNTWGYLLEKEWSVEIVSPAELEVLALNDKDELGYLAAQQDWVDDCGEPLEEAQQWAADKLAKAGRLPRFAEFFSTEDEVTR